MVADPDLGEAHPALQNLVRSWYRNHEATYQWVWGQLSEIRDVWQAQDHDTRVGLLKGSFIFTIFSIQNDTDIAEEAFLRVLDGDGVYEAGEDAGLLYLNQKAGWIYESLSRDDVWHEAVDMIDAGQVDRAHQLLADETKGLGTAKTGFILANVGLVQKMCVDVNVAKLLANDPDVTDECGDDDDCEGNSVICLGGQCIDDPQPTTDVVETYEGVCGDVMAMFPELSQDLEPYHLQWLLFDFQRFYRFASSGSRSVQAPGEGKKVATHNMWFDLATSRPSDVASRMRTLTDDAHDVKRALEMDPKYGDYDEITTMMHWEALGTDEIPVLLEKAGLNVDVPYDEDLAAYEEYEEQIIADVESQVEAEAAERDVADAINEAVNGD